MQNEISNKSQNIEIENVILVFLMFRAVFEINKRMKELKYTNIQLKRYQQPAKMIKIIKMHGKKEARLAQIPVALNDDFWFESEANGSVLVGESR